MPMDHTNKVAEALEDFITPPGIPWGRIALLFLIMGLVHIVAHAWVWNKNGRYIERGPVVCRIDNQVYDCPPK